MTSTVLTGPEPLRPAWVTVDLEVIRRNVEVLARLVAPARLLAVVKADAYGHGAVAVAKTALAAGAHVLGVAMIEEALHLRDAGITAPILMLSEPQPSAMGAAAKGGLVLTIYSRAGIESAARAARLQKSRIAVHLKVDTGLHRVGAKPDDLVALAREVHSHPELDLEGLWTHFSTADEPDDDFVREQQRVFASVLDDLRGAGLAPRVVHAANSAAVIRYPDPSWEWARSGIALYGCLPSRHVALPDDIQAALELRSQVTNVQHLDVGETVGYGRRYTTSQPTVVATVPIGYADGVSRQLGVGRGEVLIRGRRRPIAGAVSMDQIVIDCGRPEPATDPRPGDEVVLIGTQGDETITVEEWAERTDTIVYEILTRLGPRLPRRYRPAAQSSEAQQ